jgi:lipopolysaccharide transport system ATP-binding protein
VLPHVDAFIDLATITQTSNGQARCVAVALCDLAGNGKGHFRQGETALFYYEFEAEDNFEVPVCGLTIANERGVIVHGKNSWQASEEAPTYCRRGSRIICQQQIRLDLGLGEYTFQVGLVSVPHEAWDQRKRIPFEEEFGLMTRICHTSNVASFTIGLQLREGVSCLTHHGVADLPGSVEIACHAPTDIIERDQRIRLTDSLQ